VKPAEQEHEKVLLKFSSQTPEFSQGLDTQLSKSFSQFCPAKPSIHVHVYLLNRSTQVPLCAYVSTKKNHSNVVVKTIFPVISAKSPSIIATLIIAQTMAYV
jgi:hypothetical protein